MKNSAFIIAVSLLLAVSLSLCGCSACSREMLSSSGAPAPETIPDHKPDLSSSELPANLAEGSVAIKPSAELSALPMTADFANLSALDSSAILWGPGTLKDEQGRSTACIELQEKYGNYGAYFIAPTEGNTITLTFDQGYENGYTSPILDTLKEKNVQAVFFLTGHYVRSQPELVQRMIDEGHILGNHSDSHKVYCKELTAEESLKDAIWMQQYLRDNFNYEMRLFRFPAGEFSEQALSLIQQMGYQSLFWSFAYGDWNVNKQPEPAAALQKITDYLHSGEIMLLHSVSATNAEILPQLIDVIREKGYAIGAFEGMACEQPKKSAD